MTTVVPELPAEVMAALGPVLDMLGAEIRTDVAASLQEKARYEGQRVVDRNGGGGYQTGFNRIVADVFGNDTKKTSVPPAPSIAIDDDDDSERTCECRDCNGSTCQGDCEWCDDRDCDQCHPDYHPDSLDCGTCHDINSCCGYCDWCDRHHDYGDQHSYCSQCERCSECNHYCGGGY